MKIQFCHCVYIAGISMVMSLYTQAVFAQHSKSDLDVTYNIGLVSDYRYRAISQTTLKPALQGGFDAVSPQSGLYVGAWFSTISWTKDAGGSGSVEADIYISHRGEFENKINYDVGVLTYVYPSNSLETVPGFANANTTEWFAQLGNGPFTLKYSHSLTNLFGFIDSKGSGYLDVAMAHPINDDYTLQLHWGRQIIKNNAAYSYSDWKIGLNRNYQGMNLGVALIGTNADKQLYKTPTSRFTGKTSLLFSAVKNF